MAEFPTHPDEVTACWLEQALGVRPESWHWQPIGTGQVGDSVRFELTIAEHAGPKSVAAKFPAADETSRNTAAMFGLYRKEVCFYREIAPLLAVRVPHVYASALCEETGSDFVLLFEDLGPARGGDQIAGCTVEDARAAIRQAAAIHAPSWRNETILTTEWLLTQPAVTAQVRALYPQAQAVWRDRYVDSFEPEFMQLAEQLAARADTVFPAEAAAPVSLVHGDFRLDNMLFDIRGGKEEIAILDWQTVTLGNPMTDIGYFMGCGIGDALRQEAEDELLALYCSEMAGRGVTLEVSDIWDDYRRGALHGLTTAVFSAAFVERTERGDANFLSMARGAAALALQHDSLGALEGDT